MWYRILVLLLFVPIAAFAWTGTCVRVVDGDDLVVLQSGKEKRIRLFGVDAPELGQPYGMEAKKELEGLVLGKKVNIYSTKKDRYGRTLGWVTREGVEINGELVLRGSAWWYVKYAREEDGLQTAQEIAQSTKSGLWGLEKPIAPWVWRRR